MEVLFFITVIPALLLIHYFLFKKETKQLLEEKLGTIFINNFYRILYVALSAGIIYVFLSSLFKIPDIEIFNMQDSFSNIVFLIIDTFRLIFLFLIIESIWTLGISRFLGIKQLVSFFLKKKPTFYYDFIKGDINIKGLYVRHRHPFLFYMILFIILDRSFSLQNLFALFFCAGYYFLFSKLVENQLGEAFGGNYINYKKNVNYFWLMLKKYKNEPTKN